MAEKAEINDAPPTHKSSQHAKIPVGNPTMSPVQID